MRLFKKKPEGTKCTKCNLECYTEEKLERHINKAHKDYQTNRTNRRGLMKNKVLDFG
jgi:hypothetical protein